MTRRIPKKGPTKRMVQVAEELRQALSSILSEGKVKDPRLDLAVMITVTEVSLTPDLRVAKVYVSVFPEDEQIERQVMEGLVSAKQELRRALGHRVTLRYLPDLDLRVDRTLSYAMRIEAVLNEVKSGASSGEDHLASVPESETH
jgi:ribosome-binding factor A